MTFDCKAEIDGGESAFHNLSWHLLFETDLSSEKGWIQSMCITDKYIVVIEDGGAEGDLDEIRAYYRYDIDENGNPVTPYSLAKASAPTDLEHANSMTYNPNTDRIYVSYYEDKNPENKGSIGILDPNTLEKLGNIHILDKENISAIEYVKEEDQYIICSSSKHYFYVLNSDFEIVEEMGRGFAAYGRCFQDIAVSEDYILTTPLTVTLGLPSYLSIYSRSKGVKEASSIVEIEMPLPDGYTHAEPESIAETTPGTFIIAVPMLTDTGKRICRFYQTAIPFWFNIDIITENGESIRTVRLKRGSDLPVVYAPQPGFDLANVSIDGENLELVNGHVNFSKSYTFQNIQEDHTIQIDYMPVARTAPEIRDPLLPAVEEPAEETGVLTTLLARTAGITHTAQTVLRSAARSLYPYRVILATLLCIGAFSLVWARIVHHVELERKRKEQYYRRRRQRLARNMEDVFREAEAQQLKLAYIIGENG